MNTYRAIGLMSGSSLDGLDISYTEYIENNGSWTFDLIDGKTVPFPAQLMQTLSHIREIRGEELIRFDVELGSWMGTCCKEFCNENGIRPSLIGSHGHTVYHDPGNQFTYQIGNGQTLANEAGCTTVCNFRIQDVLLGGEGAPLVPIGDLLLLSRHPVCVNLGGIANLSVKKGGSIKAWDVVACNQVLNKLANRLGQPFDRGGQMAKAGRLIPEWFDQLRSNPYYQQQPPKSMSNEWVAETLLAHLPDADPKDMLHTYTRFVAKTIYEAMYPEKELFVSGGGAHNLFLMDCLVDTGCQPTIPDPAIIDFKEAIVFGFMAVLKSLDLPNVLKSVTGAQKDTSSGYIFHPM